MKRHSLFQNLSFSLPKQLLEQVLKLPKKNQPMACGCFVLPMPLNEKRSRLIMPRMLMLMDVHSERIHAMELISLEHGKLWDITTALTQMLQQFIKLGARPSQLRFNGRLLHNVGKQFCTQLDVAYDNHPFHPMYRAVRAFTTQFRG